MPEDRFAWSEFTDQVERLRRRYPCLKIDQYRADIESAKVHAEAYILPGYPLLLPETDVQAYEEACESIRLCTRRMRLRIRSACLRFSHSLFSNDSSD